MVADRLPPGSRPGARRRKMGSIKNPTNKRTEVGGSPSEGGRPKTGTSRKAKRKSRKKSKKSGKQTCTSYTLEERLAAVAAFRKSALPLEEFSQLWGMSKAPIV